MSISPTARTALSSAALLGGGLLVLDQRPKLAGVLIGLLAYKPQLGVLIPLVLIATGRWTVIAAAAATVLITCAATLRSSACRPWLAFAESLTFVRVVVLEGGDIGWQKIQSLFTAVMMWGGKVEIAYTAQIALALGVATSLVWLWRRPVAYELKAAGLACASLLATPYVLDYDLVVLAVAIAFFVRYGLERGSAITRSACWRSFGQPHWSPATLPAPSVCRSGSPPCSRSTR